MESLVHDIRYALRTLARRPLFTLAATLTLSLGIGANAAVFGLVDALLLRAPEGVSSPDRLVAVFTSDFSGPAFGTSSYPDYLDLREADVFQGMAAWAAANAGLTTERGAEPVVSLGVTADYFAVLGARPALGRFFRPDEEQAPGDGVVVSWGLWQRELGGSADAIGRTVQVNGYPLEVIGVTAAGFTGFQRGVQPELWLPLRTAARIGGLFVAFEGRDSRGLSIVARLASGATLDQAQAAMQLAAARLHGVDPAAWTDVRGEIRRLTVLPEREVRVPPDTRGTALGVAGVLSGAAALVLLMCCANVAGLLLARATGRQREIGVRLSLGAGKRRLIRQLLTESFVLASMGGVGGVLLAFWGMDLIEGTAELRATLGFPIAVSVDGRLLGFAVLLALLTAALFGLVPALRTSRLDLATVLRAESAGTTGRRVRSAGRNVLVGGQIAVSVILLVTALLLVRTLRNAYGADPGFETRNVLLISAGPVPGGGGDDEGLAALQIRDRLAALPGVDAAGWGWFRPLQGGGPRRGTSIEGYQPSAGEDMEVHVDHVGPGFFETLRIRVRAGRAIDARDRDGAPPVVVINEAFARRYWPGQDPLGRRIEQGEAAFTVIGVAEDARFFSATEEPRPQIYLSALQSPRGATFYVRTGGAVERIIPAAREVIAETAPGWSIAGLRTMQQQRGVLLGGQRLAGGAVALFALLALLLATIGLYGIVAFAVTHRAREIGVRMALGARHTQVVGLFLRQALPIIAAGSALGFVGAFAATRALRGLLIGVTATDLVSYAAAAALLGSVALLATWIPARRAARLDPMFVLRAE